MAAEQDYRRTGAEDMRKVLALSILFSLLLTGMAGAIMPANWQTWQNYSIALFFDTPTPYIEVYHPDVVDENGTIIQEAWTETVPAIIDVGGIAEAHGWRSAVAYFVTVDPKLNET